MCRIDWWGEDAFVIPNGTQPGHPFDPNVVGPIHRLTNKALFEDLDDPRVFVDVWLVVDDRALPIRPAVAAQPRPNPPPPPPPWRMRSVHNPVRCLVDTGAKESVFEAEVAKDLGLNPNWVPSDKIRLIRVPIDEDRTAPRLCAEFDLWLDLLPEMTLQLVYVPVLFPVDRVIDLSTGLPRYRWKTGLPWRNVIGMREVLNRVMLCFTPEVLFVFPRKP